jgi:hypothetical protein
MGMLAEALSGIEVDAPSPFFRTGYHTIRSEFYGYIRRLPSRVHCEIVFREFFGAVNTLLVVLEEIVFQEKCDRWWTLAPEVVLKHGPDGLPDDLLHFPALLFQVLALGLLFLPRSYDTRLDELKFSPLQSLVDLSYEYADCGVALSKLLKAKPTLTTIQYNITRDCWLVNTGDLIHAWNHSGNSIR